MELNKQDVQALIGILQKLITDHTDQEETTTKRGQPVKSKEKKQQRRKTQPEHYNSFVDMPEHNMHREDTAIDKKLRKFPPTPRNRPATFIDAKCRVCGKEETISSKIVPESIDRYKCNTCSQTGG